MNPKFKKLVEQVIRFFKGRNISITTRGAIVVIIGGSVVIAGFAFVMMGLLGSSLLGLFNEVKNDGLGHWAIWKGASALAISLLFIMTIGIPLMFNELRNWFTRFVAGAFVIGGAGGAWKIFFPIVDHNELAVALLAGSILTFTLGSLIGLMTERDKLGKMVLSFGATLTMLLALTLAGERVIAFVKEWRNESRTWHTQEQIRTNDICGRELGPEWSLYKSLDIELNEEQRRDYQVVHTGGEWRVPVSITKTGCTKVFLNKQEAGLECGGNSVEHVLPYDQSPTKWIGFECQSNSCRVLLATCSKPR